VRIICAILLDEKRNFGACDYWRDLDRTNYHASDPVEVLPCDYNECKTMEHHPACGIYL